MVTRQKFPRKKARIDPLANKRVRVSLRVQIYVTEN